MLELIKIDSTIQLDIRYARHDNFVGRPVYDQARAFLMRDAANALIKVHQELSKSGHGLVVFDAYRPWKVTKLFWEVVNTEQRKYVADPEIGSQHNRGCAVDLSLFDFETGRQLEMPSEFDEFNEKAHPGFEGGSKLQRENRDLLISAMAAEGFTVNRNEWWHFDHHSWSQHEIMDIGFDEIVVDG